MGTVTTREALALRWADVCNDHSLRDLPYKIELNYGIKLDLPAPLAGA
jgi:hypothetical protein